MSKLYEGVLLIRKDVFVMGLNEFNLRMLKRIPGAENYQFHALLRPEDVLETYHFPMQELLDGARAQLTKFLRSKNGKIDAIVGYMDFPVSTMLPILCAEFGTVGPTLEGLLKCEHKYWSRLVQQTVIPDHIPRFRVFDPFDSDALAHIDLDYPFWVKPIKSSGSFLGFHVKNEHDFKTAISAITEHINLIAEPFGHLLDHVELPADVAEVPAHGCVAESIIGGRQCTLEGYSQHGRLERLGVVDSIRYENLVSFFRYEYPSTLPDAVQKRMWEVTTKVIPALGFDNSAFNIEYFWDRTRDSIWLLEVNTRVSQSHSDLFEKVDGVSNQAATVKVGLDESFRFPHRSGAWSCAAKFFWRVFADGVVRRVPSDEEIDIVSREMPGTRVRPQVSVGMELNELLEQDSYSYAIAEIYIGAESRKELLDKYMRCQQLLRFDIEPVRRK